MEQKKKGILFWVVNILIAAVVLIFIIQNWGKVEFNFLGLKLEGFGFLVFLVIFVLGFVSGWLTAYFRTRKPNRKSKQDKELHYIEE